MTPAHPQLANLLADLKVACLFYTRLPLAHASAIGGTDIARASWAAPVVGAAIGVVAGAAYWLAHAAGLPPLVAATLALTVGLVVTGCLHEDGLADTADGLGGGATRETKLAIMRDSRIGTYGACALALSIVLRVGAIASLAEPALVASALIAAHAAARAALPAVMSLVPPARPDGLAADAGAPLAWSAAAAVLLGLAALLVGLGPARGLVACLVIAAATSLTALLAIRQIGGHTGDVLGAVEQAGEIAVLLVAVARP